MEYTQLGRTGLRVRRLCLGMMNWPWLTTEGEAYAIMDHSLELGINFSSPQMSTAASLAGA
jgi:1-deoxyxylulose-5-phosphate synthase